MYFNENNNTIINFPHLISNVKNSFVGFEQRQRKNGTQK